MQGQTMKIGGQDSGPCGSPGLAFSFTVAQNLSMWAERAPAGLENPSAFSKMSQLPTWEAEPWRRDPEAVPALQPINSAALGLAVSSPAPSSGQEGAVKPPPGPVLRAPGAGTWAETEAAPSSSGSRPPGQTTGPSLNK